MLIELKIAEDDEMAMSSPKMFTATLLMCLARGVSQAPFEEGAGAGANVPLAAQSTTAPGTCPIDINKVHLEGLGDSCGDAQRPDLCTACICDMTERLVSAGYEVTGPNAIPFESCALQNAQALMAHGVTVGAMLKVAQCPEEQPACVEKI